MKTALARVTWALALGLFFCLTATDSWCAAIEDSSDYGTGNPPFARCSDGLPNGVSFNGVTATCYGPFHTNDLLYHFTLDSPSPSTLVTSFTIDFPAAPTAFDLVVGCQGNLAPFPLALPSPSCTPATSANTILPFDVSGPKTAGSSVYTFSNFTGDQSGKVTVSFHFGSGTREPPFPLITDITTTAAPEPGSFALFAAGMVVGFGLSLRNRRRLWGSKLNSSSTPLL